MINFFFNIFHQNEKIKIIILVILMILAMLLEVAGISLIIPAILILLKGTDATTEMFFFKFFSDSLIEINDDNILIYGVLFLFFIFLVKYLIIGILYFFQYNFTAKLMLRISTDILNNYLKKPYIYFLNASSSRLINNLIKQVEIFVTQGLEPLITILSETILLVGIFFVLLYIDYKSVFFFLVVILLPSIFFYFLIKNKVKVWGNLQQTSDEKVLETLQHTLHGIKEIKIFIREKNFSNLFNAHFRNSVNMRKNLLLLNQFPRIWLEIISIFTICTLVIFYAKFNKSGEEIISMLAIFGVASVRLLPSLNRIFLSAQNLRFSFAATKRVYNELNDKEEKIIIKSNLKIKKNFEIENFEKIEFKNVNFKYNDTSYLKSINLKITKGQFVGINGDTGSGKSTFIDLICGLLPPDTGKILVNSNIDLNTISKAWKQKIGYVPQIINLLDDTIEKNITFEDDESLVKNEWLNKCLHACEILEFVKNLPGGLKTRIGERGIRISGGQKQRIILARALYINPEILILDESTNALDIKTEQKILKNLLNWEKKITIIMISHKKSSLLNCDVIFNILNHNINEIKIKNL